MTFRNRPSRQSVRRTPGWGLPGVNRFAPLALAATAVVVALLAIGFLVRSTNIGPPAVPQPTAAPTVQSGTWTATGSMTEGRDAHSATLLPDGRVLVAGGSEAATSEVYDPATGTWAASGVMTAARGGHSATALQDGRVLVVGGYRMGVDEDGVGRNVAMTSAELYDPATGSWTATEDMLIGQRGAGHTATLLPDGRVLVVGGFPGGTMLAAAELFDPATGSWTATGAMIQPRGYHTATLLPDGTVLVAGSLSSETSAELYDPETGIWTETGSMAHGRHDFTATLLPDGTVLVTASEGTNTAELFDQATGTWTETGSMLDVRLGTYRATLLSDGSVLATGGVPNRHAVVELYDPDTGEWTRVADTSVGRHDHTATLLRDGSVLVTGGSLDVASAELYGLNGIAASRCEPASALLASNLGTRLTDSDVGVAIPGGVSLGDAFIVKSGELDDTYFIGAAIQGQGMANLGGVWATDDPNGGGSIFAVSSTASEFSNWPDRPNLGFVVDRRVEPDETAPDGFFEANDCAHQ